MTLTEPGYYWARKIIGKNEDGSNKLKDYSIYWVVKFKSCYAVMDGPDDMCDPADYTDWFGPLQSPGKD